MAAQITVNYQGKLRFEAKREKTGKLVQTDVPADHGGQDEYFSPTELTAVALSTCIGSMMAVVGERNGIDLSKMQILANMEMTVLPVRRIGEIKLLIVLPDSKNISEDNRQKLENAARTCPVKNSLHPDIKIHMEFVYQ